MAGVLFVYEGAVVRHCCCQPDEAMRVRVLRVLLLLLLLLLLLFVHAGVCGVASMDVQSLVKFLFRFRIVTASFTTVGIPRWPEPTSPFSHFS